MRQTRLLWKILMASRSPPLPLILLHFNTIGCTISFVAVLSCLACVSGLLLLRYNFEQSSSLFANPNKWYVFWRVWHTLVVYNRSKSMLTSVQCCSVSVVLSVRADAGVRRPRAGLLRQRRLRHGSTEHRRRQAIRHQARRLPSLGSYTSNNILD